MQSIEDYRQKSREDVWFQDSSEFWIWPTNRFDSCCKMYGVVNKQLEAQQYLASEVLTAASKKHSYE
jgi:hypothetical protein